MDSFEEWKAQEQEALKGGLTEAISQAKARLLSSNTPEETREQLNWYAHFENLRADKSGNLPILIRLISYSIDRNGWTLFLICVELFNAGLYQLCVKTCEQFLRAHDHDLDGAKLLCSAALWQLGQQQKARDLAHSIVDPETSVWAGGRLLRLSDFGDHA